MLKRVGTRIPVISILGTLVPLASAAAQVPPEFRGVWILADKTGNECKATDWPTNDRLVNITSRDVEYLTELGCQLIARKIVNADAGGEQTAEVNLACSGDGSTWRSKEVWHITTVDSRKVLLKLSLGSLRKETRLESGSPVKRRAQTSPSILNANSQRATTIGGRALEVARLNLP
jgi:hypothetical protein